MDKVLVVVVGLEGGGVYVYGRQKDGIWSFWVEDSYMVLDEDLNDSWQGWVSDPVEDLSLAMPPSWPLNSPREINPVFLDWFRNKYDEACSQLAEHCQRSHRQGGHRKWMWMLNGKTDEDLELP